MVVLSVGIANARSRGAELSRGEVLVFLDSHCEGTRDWLRPLLSRIKDSRTAVLTPLIDSIQQDTFQYEAGDIYYYQVMVGCWGTPLVLVLEDLVYRG